MDISLHKNQFGNHAEDYTKYRAPYIKEVHDVFFSLLSKEGKRILDIACGTGKSTEPLVRDGFEVFGCDIDPLMITEAQKQASNKNLSINYQVANAERLPYPDNYFDAVTVGTAFHWFATPEALTEIKRVMKTGALLFVYWTLTTKDIPEEDEIPSEIFRKYNWDKVPSHLRDLDYISKLFIENNLQKVSTKQLSFMYNTTIEERVGLMKTSSCYNLFSQETKENFDNELSEILTKKLGSRPHFTLEEEIQIVFGVK